MREDLNYPQIDKQKLDIVKKLIDSIAGPSNGDCSYALMLKMWLPIHSIEEKDMLRSA